MNNVHANAYSLFLMPILEEHENTCFILNLVGFFFLKGNGGEN